MDSRKRLRDDDDQPIAKRTRSQVKRMGEVQKENGNSSPLKPLEDFQVHIKLRSTSKAAQNDPILTLSQREVYQKHLSDMSIDGPGADPFAAALWAAFEDKPKHEIDASRSEATPSFYGDCHGISEKDKFSGDEYTTKPITTERANRSSFQMENTSAEDDSNFEDKQDYEDYEDIDDDDDEDEEEEEEEDYDCSEYDNNFEFKWLETIDIEVTLPSTQDGCIKPVQVAYCHANLIRRGQIRDDFYEEMEQPSDETAKLAFDLFDRYGRLRSEFKSHPVIKGTGVWSQELDRGDMLLIERVYVTPLYRRQKLGRRMVEAMLQLAQLKTWTYFAFVWPSMLRLHDIGSEYDNLEDDAAKAEMEDREGDRAAAFYRSLGFRRVGSTIWFAATPDDKHPSRRLASADDYDPPKPLSSTLDPLLRPFEQTEDLRSAIQEQLSGQKPGPTADFLKVLEGCIQEKDAADPCWMGQDTHGNSILHLAAKRFDFACVEWILSQDFGARLLQLRNNRGETPLELLEFKLERERTYKAINYFIQCVSDQFEGHSESAVRCLILLKQLDRPKSSIVQQLAGGCTCGHCLYGFLSPRMSHALQYSARYGNDILRDFITDPKGQTWIELNEHRLGYLPSKVRNNFATNKSMRQGYANLWEYIADCLEVGNRPPSERNILAIVRDTSEWPPSASNYLKRGGTVEAAFLAICRSAMQQDDLIGEIFLEVDEEMASLPECRNDKEFGYVSGCCGYRRISLVHRVNMMGQTLDEDRNVIDSQW